MLSAIVSDLLKLVEAAMFKFLQVQKKIKKINSIYIYEMYLRICEEGYIVFCVDYDDKRGLYL